MGTRDGSAGDGAWKSFSRTELVNPCVRRKKLQYQWGGDAWFSELVSQTPLFFPGHHFLYYLLLSHIPGLGRANLRAQGPFCLTQSPAEYNLFKGVSRLVSFPTYKSLLVSSGHSPQGQNLTRGRKFKSDSAPYLLAHLGELTDSRLFL